MLFRSDHFESNELIQKKAAAAHAAGLNVVICIGETGQERDEGKTIKVCQDEIFGSVPDDATAKNTVIAYEPIWAIGTGKTPTAADVEEVHAAIRKALAKKLGKATANKMVFKMFFLLEKFFLLCYKLSSFKQIF